MSDSALQEMSIGEVAKNLKLAFLMAGVNPAKDTIVEAANKFRELGLRHLVLYLSTGGFLCLCSDAEMSKRLRKAILAIDKELDAEEAENILGSPE